MNNTVALFTFCKFPNLKNQQDIDNRLLRNAASEKLLKVRWGYFIWTKTHLFMYIACDAQWQI